MNYWLIKSEPNCYSLDELKHDGSIPWEGVRNYQARNFMRNGMKVGDKAIFYHSSESPVQAVGIAEVCSEPHTDMSAFDPQDDHFDPKSSPDNPTWILVDFKYRSTFKKPVTLEAMKSDPQLAGMVVTQRGSRLSIQPVSEEHFNRVVELGSN